MKFKITGADRETGESTEFIVDASDKSAAEDAALEKGILIGDISLIDTSEKPVTKAKEILHMNKMQARILYIGLAVLVVMLLIPPWEIHGSGTRRLNGPYGLIFFPPIFGKNSHYGVDFSRLALGIAADAVISLMLIFRYRDSS